jgi:peptidoglycan/xylan/chitin deacetylase (PgdA/CDA1 family)
MTIPPHRPWRPSQLIQASAVLHFGAAAATLAQPSVWPWAFGAVAADHALLTALGLWPRSSLLGPNWTRLPPAAAARGEIALTIDDGPDPEVTPQVLDMLDEHRAVANFFCIGARALRHPDLCREIVRRGHALENHSMNHRPTFSFLGVGGLTRELREAQAALSELAGTAPRFFRAPAGLRNPLLDPVLHRLDLRLASWTRRGYDTREGDARKVGARLTQNLRAGDILLLHDGNAARTQAGGPVILAVLPRLLDAAAAAGLRWASLRAALDADGSPE